MLPNGASVAGMGASVNGFVAGNGAFVIGTSVIGASTREKTLFEGRASLKKITSLVG